AVLSHLRRGAPTVQVGERVRAGQVIGRCGTSGNSSDPHVHFQLMDGPDIDSARGLPFTWRHLDEAGAVRQGVPANEELFTAIAETPHCRVRSVTGLSSGWAAGATSRHDRGTARPGASRTL